MGESVKPKYVFSIFRSGGGQCAVYCHEHSYFKDSSKLYENEDDAVAHILNDLMASMDYPMRKDDIVEINLADGSVKRMEYRSPWKDV